MNTRVFRIDLVTEPDLAAAIQAACDKQLTEGFKLASTFVWKTDLVLIFQKTS
jgi:hypothetical protein